jgi:membrane protein DedA with SNARE-associated domain/rhodanese-related sulfurtransferase
VGDIHHILAELAAHGYLIYFGWTAAEALGAPLPAAPILLAAGVLTATGRLSFCTAWGFGVLACFIGDVLWYGVGRRWGTRVLRWLDRISVGPETYRRRASDFVSRYGSRTMLIAKFLPGISTFAAPLTAASGITLPGFLLYEIPGSIVYIGIWLFLGRILGRRIETVFLLAHFAASASIGFALLGAVALVAFRYAQRRSFRRQMRMSRITPPELHNLILRGLDPLIVDLRHPLDMLTDPRVLPGAVRLNPEKLSMRQVNFPRDRDIVLYCTCPSEASSASIALRLKAMGITRVRPLLGGFDAWKRLGYPLEDATDRIGWPTQVQPGSTAHTPSNIVPVRP